MRLPSPSQHPNNQGPLLIDLFAGAGGMSLGLEKAGFKPIGAFEWNQMAADTYRANFKGELLVSGFGPIEGDISKLSPQGIAQTLASKGIAMGTKLSPGEVDLLAAGPPCQGFSRVGRAKLNSLAGAVDAFRHDPRNQLYLRALKIVKAVMPKAVLLENVPGILHLSGTNMAEVISKALEDLGYNVKYTILNAAWYGVPQTRERVFILGFHKNLCLQGSPSFPQIRNQVDPPRGGLTSNDLNNSGWKYYLPLSSLEKSAPTIPQSVTAEEALSDLPAFMAHLDYVDRWGYTIKPGFKSSRQYHPPVSYKEVQPNGYQALMRGWHSALLATEVTDHFCRWVPRDFWTFAGMKGGHNYLDALQVAERRFASAVEDYNNGILHREPFDSDFIPPYCTDNFHEKWRKLYRNRPSWTLTAHLGKDTYSHIHYDKTQARAITPREAARLQSFPDGYQFHGNTGEMFRQIGNAVPPLLALALGECILDQLKGASSLPSLPNRAKRVPKVPKKNPKRRMQWKVPILG